ncbi:protein tyrosine phosphatase family protein [Sphingomonas sp. 10B4]|uniref:protein tyrosine phosphatase family protein n=1 Tax=Sphingomonas sp. 10B4 TaxID=3048575 RepID=UPI002AB4D678|nr:protein tyrosine phosphatase family protein [Sphingomonas sp. 10B4]MDY7524120.1 protein tyrosine phosphatase family protein [Sphingomonas sp. 10B4]MEB0281738.1 protein tyrosine phosphatase family protein [Sphingomonas sp. 10B4]
MHDPVDIPNWHRLDDQLTTSGQPSGEQFADIAALGVRDVINLALHEHPRALPDEAATVAALGMRYSHIPVAFDAPTDADFERFWTVMEEIGDRPVHIHCIVNARVSAFLYRYRRERLGWDEAQARPALDAIWRPGGVWARFIGDTASEPLAHRMPAAPPQT